MYSFSSQSVTSWLRDIEVKDVTNTSAVIQYTTADCVIPDNLTIELNIDVDYSNINPSSVVSYKSSTTDQFTVLGLEPNAVVTYTLQVIAEVSDNFLNIGMSRTGSFTVISATTTLSTSISSTATTTTNSLASTTRGTSSGIFLVYEIFANNNFHSHLLVITTVTSTPDINTKCSGN